MKVELDLFRPDDYEAFAVFCQSVARSRTREHSEVEQKLFAEPGPAIPVPTEPITDEQAKSIVAAATATRERGKPSPGNARRTKAEIAEDEAADKADAALKAAGEETGAVVADKQVDRAISASPEDRQDPDNPDAEQDAADEAAETEANRDTEKPLTHDDVRGALGRYVKAYGMAAAQEDGPVLIGKVLGDAAKTKVSDLPADQAMLKRAIDGVQEMLEKNPFGRKADL